MVFKQKSVASTDAAPINPTEVARKRRFAKIGLTVMIALAIFSLGVNVGNGRVRFGAHTGRTGLSAQLDYTTVNDIYAAIRQNYNGKLTEAQMLDGLKHGLAEATNDPYTQYFTAAEAKKFNEELNNSFSGIGAELGQDADKNIIVIAPIKGFPAEKAGLQAQDIIVSINGKSTQGMSVDEAVSVVRGPKGTDVKLGIVRGADSLTLTITRDNIQLPSVTTKTLDGNIGYLQISSFSSDTAQLVQKAADGFKSQNVKGIIVDLRNDPGGLLDAAVDVSSEWVPQGKLVVEERGTSGDDKHFASGKSELAAIPTVVLVNSGSASAAEITAGALHDNKRATIIGEKSYGKGVVQQLVNFPDGSQLKVTVASWFRPNGQNINHKGITPDQIVKLTADDAKANNDTQLTAAEAFLNK